MTGFNGTGSRQGTTAGPWLAWGLGLVLVLVATLLAAGPAAAQARQTPPPVTVSPSRVVAGSTVVVSGVCPGSFYSTVRVDLLDTDAPGARSLHHDTFLSANGGYFSTRFLVPLTDTGGTGVRVACDDGDRTYASTVPGPTVLIGCEPAATAWNDWGGVVSSGASAVADHEYLDGFVVADPGRLYWRRLDRDVPRLVRWSNLGRPAGITLSGTPGTVRWRGGDTTNVYVRGDDGAVWQRYLQRQTWHGWSSIGGVVDRGVAAAAEDGVLDVFAIAEGRLYQRRYENGEWGRWRNIGSPAGTTLTADAPAAVAWRDGYVNVYARGADGAIWQRYRHPGGGWSQWTSLGGRLATGPAAVATNAGQVDVFAVAPNGELYRRTWDDDTGWSVWAYHGSPSDTHLERQPAAAALSADQVATLTPDDTGGLWHGHHPCNEPDRPVD